MKRAKRTSMTLLKTLYDMQQAVYHKTFFEPNTLNNIGIQFRNYTGEAPAKFRGVFEGLYRYIIVFFSALKPVYFLRHRSAGHRLYYRPAPMA